MSDTRRGDGSPDASTGGDDETLAELFWGVARRLRRVPRETAGAPDVVPSHGRALVVLSRHGVMRLSDLAEHLRIAARSTTEVVDALEGRGLVERQPDPGDRRATLVVLTDEGRRATEVIHAARQVEAEAFFGALSDSDRADLVRILQTLRG